MRLILSKYPRPFKEKHKGDSTIIYETGKRVTDYGDLQNAFDEYVEETEGDTGPTTVMLDIAPHHNVQPQTEGTYPTQYNYDKKVLSEFEEAVKKFKPSAIDVLKTASRLQDKKIKDQILSMLFKDDTWLAEICDYL